MGCRVRRVTAQDWVLARELRLAALKDAPEAFSSRYEDERRLPEASWKARAQSHEEGRSSVSFLAEVDGKSGPSPAGLVVGLSAREAAPPWAELVSLWVDPDARGHGAGRALVEAVIAWAATVGATRVRLRVAGDNPAARALYLRAGFVPDGPGGRCGWNEASEWMSRPIGPAREPD